MRVLIIGGSNSVMAEGYTSRLKELKSISKIVNLSVGGTTSLTAIGRLLSSQNHGDFDLILYEYSLNDTGHFYARSDGVQSWMLMFQFILQSCVQLYPKANFIPILLSESRFFDINTVNHIYNIQINIYKFLNIQFIDIRKYFWELFGNILPSWLYYDSAHYSNPYGIDLVGLHVIKKIEEFSVDRKNNLASVWFKFLSSTACLPFVCNFISPSRLFGSSNILYEKNSLMDVEFSRIESGTGVHIKLDSFPMVLFVKSDAQHAVLNVGIESPGFSGNGSNINISTCHADAPRHSFVYTSIPLSLFYSQSLLSIGGNTTLNLISPTKWDNSTVRTFDAFVLNDEFDVKNYFDFAGFLTIKSLI